MDFESPCLVCGEDKSYDDFVYTGGPCRACYWIAANIRGRVTKIKRANARHRIALVLEPYYLQPGMVWEATTKPKKADIVRIVVELPDPETIRYIAMAPNGVQSLGEAPRASFDAWISSQKTQLSELHFEGRMIKVVQTGSKPPKTGPEEGRFGKIYESWFAGTYEPERTGLEPVIVRGG
jgi:hypothetical protein